MHIPVPSTKKRCNFLSDPRLQQHRTTAALKRKSSAQSKSLISIICALAEKTDCDCAHLCGVRSVLTRVFFLHFNQHTALVQRIRTDAGPFPPEQQQRRASLPLWGSSRGNIWLRRAKKSTRIKSLCRPRSSSQPPREGSTSGVAAPPAVCWEITGRLAIAPLLLTTPAAIVVAAARPRCGNPFPNVSDLTCTIRTRSDTAHANDLVDVEEKKPRTISPLISPVDVST